MLCRVWVVSVLGLLLLSLSNIFLTLKMIGPREEFSVCRSSPPQFTSDLASMKQINLTSYLAFLRDTHTLSDAHQKPCGDPEWAIESSSTPPQSAFTVDVFSGRWDTRREYKIHDSVYRGPRYPTLARESQVTLATQSSVDRLFWIVQVARHWLGPISIAVFTPDVEFGIAKEYLKYLISCFPYVGDKIIIHFAYPKDRPPRPLDAESSGDFLALCHEPVTVLKNLLGQRSKQMMAWREKLSYPQNLLRNVARQNCHAEFVFIVDVDIVTPPEMFEKLDAFLRTSAVQSCDKCAFVIPTYEIDEKAPLPSNVSDMLALVQAGRARPFHEKVFIHNQFSTNFSLWQANVGEWLDRSGRATESPVFISHDVTFEFFYEPFYVARDAYPAHDERFVGFGFNRNTQTYEMLVAGWKFKVLAPIFSIHWGMQTKKGRPRWRETQNQNNRKLFEDFKREITVKYKSDPLGMMKPKPKPAPLSWKRGKTAS